MNYLKIKSIQCTLPNIFLQKKQLEIIFSKFINYIPVINKITDRLITLLTNDKKKTDEFVEGNFI